MRYLNQKHLVFLSQRSWLSPQAPLLLILQDRIKEQPGMLLQHG